MKRSLLSIYRTATTVLAALLLLTACGSEEYPQNATLPEPHTPCHEPFIPTPPTISTDDSILYYRTLAEAIFDGVAAANATDFTYESYGDGIRLLTYVGEGGKVVLPDEIDGKPVIALCHDLFHDNTTLTALHIPDSVSEIGENLLTGCRSLQLLRTPLLGATAESQDGHLSYFFGGNTAVGAGFRVPATLDTVILASSVKNIPDYAFYECSRLRMVFCDSTVERVGKFAFYGCNQLHTVALGIETDGPQSIDDFAFGNCTSLIAFSQFGATLGKSVLYGCTKLTRLHLDSFSENVPYLGALFGAETHMWNANYVPESLEHVSIEGGNVPDNAFYGCGHVKIVHLAGNESIGSRAFYGCTALQKIDLPDSVISVGDLAFAHCSTLASVTLSESLAALGIQAFMDCTNLTAITLPDSLSALPNSAFAGCCNLQTVTLGENVASIGAQAFRNCSSLTTVTGGKSDMTIAAGNEPLENCLN